MVPEALVFPKLYVSVFCCCTASSSYEDEQNIEGHTDHNQFIHLDMFF